MVDYHQPNQDPAQPTHLVFQLRSQATGLTVHIAESPLGQATAPIVLPRLEDVLLRSSHPTFHENVGRGLFHSLFPGTLGELYHAALAQASDNNAMLTLELRFEHDSAHIARYPWELLHDGTHFMLQQGRVNLVRSFPSSKLAPVPALKLPIEILFIAAQPHEQLQFTAEFMALQTALQPLIAADQLDLAYLLPPNRESLNDWILAGAPAILHFEAYTTFTPAGQPAFANGEHASDPSEADVLGNMFDNTDLKLAVLNANEMVHTSENDPLGRSAAALVLAGIPAVIAMQRPLSEDAAIRFLAEVYRAFLNGQTIETAVALGRKRLFRTLYWHVPTLSLRYPHTL